MFPGITEFFYEIKNEIENENELSRQIPEYLKEKMLSVAERLTRKGIQPKFFYYTSHSETEDETED